MAEAYHYELAAQGIESCLVEPGANKTEIFGNFGTVTDTPRLDTYGPAAQLPDKINSVLQPSAAEAQQVADAVLSIVETPAGQRQLRYRVSPQDFGVDQINAVCAQVQNAVLDTFGLTADTTFAHRSAASAQ